MQALWMLAAAFFFAAMSACIKFASGAFDPLEIVGYRGAIGLLAMAVLARSRGTTLATRVPWMHVWRNVIGIAAMTAWFYAIAHLPLATAMTLQYTSSLWIAVFLVGGVLMTGRLLRLRRQLPLVLAVLAGFAGVVMVLGPTLGHGHLLAGLVGVAGGLGSALAYMQVSALGRAGEPDTRTVFYFSVGCMLTGAVSTLVMGAHSLIQPAAWWLIPMGVLGALGQLCMTRAYGRGKTIVVANLQYAGIVFAALLGLTFFGDRIAPLGWLGIATLIVSGVAATTWRSRSAAPTHHT